MPAATSSWRQSRRSAEQRWPALWNAEASASRTACSGSAVESTIIALIPPVSAINGASGARWTAARRSIALAAAVEPVKQIPATRASRSSTSPSAGPSPGRSRSASGGTPASCSSATARAAISGVCSAGLAIAGLPATSAAAICPVKIASGKFHGLMQRKGPRGRRSASRVSASAA